MKISEFKRFGYKKTKNKKIIQEVKTIIESYKNDKPFIIITDIWEIRKLNDNLALAVYNKKDKYIIDINEV